MQELARYERQIGIGTCTSDSFPIWRLQEGSIGIPISRMYATDQKYVYASTTFVRHVVLPLTVKHSEAGRQRRM